MNATRRNEIRALEKRLETECAPLWERINQAATELHAKLEEIRDAYVQVKDDEQESRDNVPESMSDSERAQNMDASIYALEEVESLIEEKMSAVDEIVNAETGFDDIVGKSDEARGAE